jgi:hypothetical protein
MVGQYEVVGNGQVQVSFLMIYAEKVIVWVGLQIRCFCDIFFHFNVFGSKFENFFSFLVAGYIWYARALMYVTSLYVR